MDLAYVGNRLVHGLPPAEGETININNVQHLGGGDTDRPYFISNGRQLDIEIYSPYRRTTYHAMQMGITRPFTHGVLLKGHYTYSRSKALRTDYELPDPAVQDRNWALANGDRPHTLQMAFVYQLPWRSEDSRGIARMLINDWQLNGIFSAFSGTPFTVTADGNTLNTPGNLQTADLVGQRQQIGTSAQPAPTTTRPHGHSRRASGLEHSLPNQFRGPGGGTSTSPSSGRFS